MPARLSSLSGSMIGPRRFVVLLLFAGSLLGAQTPSPAPSPTPSPVTFAAEVAYVEVDAIVTDKNGQPVQDLTREDFVVLEDGKPQNVELFTHIDIPYEHPVPEAGRSVETDVYTNEHPFEGRLYVIVLDELHTHPMRSALVKIAARRFLERHFADGDLAAVVHTGGGAALGQELTGNRRLLLAAVDRFVGRKLQSATLSRIDEYRRTQGQRQQGDAVRDPEEAQRAYNARASLDTLKNVAEWLAPIHGRRKAVLFLSEGIDYNFGDPITNRDGSMVLDALRDSTAAAARGNVSFYTIDPRGLGGLGDEMMELQPVFDEPSLGLDPQGLQRDLQFSQDSLRTLAEETSGQAAVNANDLTGAYSSLVKDNSAYYILGFYPANQKRDGRFHKLQVRVSRPGVKVRSRSGYSTLSGKSSDRHPPTWAGAPASAPLLDLLNSPLPRSGLSMALQSAAFKGPAGPKGQAGPASVMVAVQVAGQGFRFKESSGLSHETLEMAVIAVDAAGKIRREDQKVGLDLKPRTRQIVNATSFRVVSWLNLPPGRYQVRVAARAVNAEATGSVYSDLEVPDFTKSPLSLSGLVITSASARVVPTAGSVALLKDVLPGPPTTVRVFSPADTLALMTEIYDGEKTPHTIDVVTTLTAAGGDVAYRNADQRSSEAFKQAGAGAGAAIVHTAEIPLKEVAPGTYTLRVEASSRLGKKGPVAERATVVEVVASPTPQPPPSSDPR